MASDKAWNDGILVLLRLGNDAYQQGDFQTQRALHLTAAAAARMRWSR